jgi:NTE family protein
MSGGFAKGAYQVGVLRAIRGFFTDHSIDYISSSSIGVLNAYAFVQDRLDLMEDMWRSLSFTGFRSFANTYLRGAYIPDLITEITKNPKAPTPPNFYATFINITKRTVNYIDLSKTAPQDLKDYLLASVTLPFFSKAVEIDRIKYLDGAFVDNIPVKPLMKHPLDYAIVIHFDNDNYMFENEYFDSRLIKINFLDERLVKSTFSFNQSSIEGMIKIGYDAALKIFHNIFERGLSDIEYIHQKILLTNDSREKHSFRLTGDVAVNNLNKALKKVFKDESRP